MEDDDYMSFLNAQKLNDDEIIDPVYKVFLEHLRENGKSYVFEMKNENNGLPTIIQYEGEDDSAGNILHGIRNNFVAKQGFKSNKVCSKSGTRTMDDSYMTFLTHLKFTENSMILEFDSTSIIYEDKRDASLSSEIGDDIEGLEPHVCEDGDDSSVGSDELCEITDFKTRLTVIQSKPYNQYEYNELYKKATERKPLHKQKHLRSYSKFYTTDEVGRSYFDYYPDFAAKFRHADSYTRLNLLRGFFFWLKYLSNEGAFRPWASSGYKVVPSGFDEVVLD